jgi:Protein of unknown function (DUF4446)
VDFLSSNAPAIVLVLAALCLLMIVMLQSLQVSKLSRRIDDLTGGVEGGDLETILAQHLETVRQVGRDLDEVTARTAMIESSARHHFAREGLIRFNPFPDTGGNQSFALALLDESDDGFVVSSLHSRTGTRIYAKAVVGGKADTSLSTEEQDAIDEARAKRPARVVAPPRSAAAGRSSSDVGPAVTTPAGKATPAPVAEAKPAVAAAAVPAGKAAPVPAARSSAATRPAPAPKRAPEASPAKDEEPDEEPDEESTRRTFNDRFKGQEKPKDLVAPVAVAADPEKVDRKPGMPPVTGSGRR